MEPNKDDEKFFDEMERKIVAQYNKQQLLKSKKKTEQINMKLIQKRSFPMGALKGFSQEQIAEKLISLKELHLNYCNIVQIENLEVFEHLTILHLEHNEISKIEGLEFNKHLEFLCLRSNQIKKIENLNHLQNLTYLDLTNNSIVHIDTKELPQNLINLKLSKNPCIDLPDYRKSLVLALEKLEELDGVEVTLEERLLYRNALKNSLAEKMAEKALQERLSRKMEEKKRRAEMTEAEKKENVDEFASVSELEAMMGQTKDLVKNSHKRLEEIREQSFKRIEGINDKFIKLLKVTSNKWA